jgi:deazaflavin-dependent oxidoreductase (nitroreductase family)
MPNIRWLLVLITTVQRWVYLRTNGRIGHSFFGIRILLLTTVGRRSGRPRIAPLLYVEDGERWVVAGSNMGDARPPAWWLNISANSRARIQVRTEHFEVVARRAAPEEAERLWPVLIGSYRWFEDYRESAGREIPVVLLERAPA